MPKKPKSKRAEDRPGQWLHRLVEVIERALGADEKIKIESPKRLASKVTGELREHDIIITVSGSHHTVLIALECKDWSRPVGEPEVEAFRSKCEHTGVGQGIIVSPQGFSEGGMKLAQHYGIRCLTLEQAEQFNWLGTSELGVTRTVLTVLHVQPVIASAVPSHNTDRFLIIDAKGMPARPNWHLPHAQAWHQMTEFRYDALGPRELCFRLPSFDMLLYFEKTRDRVPVLWWIVEARLSFDCGTTSFERYRYVDQTSGPITDIAIARGDAVGIKGTVVLSNRDGEAAYFSFVPDTTNSDEAISAVLEANIARGPLEPNKD